MQHRLAAAGHEHVDAVLLARGDLLHDAVLEAGEAEQFEAIAHEGDADAGAAAGTC